MSVNGDGSHEKIDVRIVQTVRALKELNPKDQRQEDNSDNSDKTSGDSSHINEDKTEKSKITDHISHNNFKHIQLSNSIGKKNSNHDNTEKLMIIPKGNPLLSTTGQIGNKKIMIESRYKNMPSSSSGSTHKSKSNFLKNLMNETSMKKYKATCFAILKDDKEIKALCEICGVANTNYSFDFFLEKNLFTNPVFLYKLEMLLSSDQVLNKNYKDKFFKQEIYIILHLKSIDIKFRSQMESLNERFNKCEDLISKINFSKN